MTAALLLAALAAGCASASPANARPSAPAMCVEAPAAVCEKVTPEEVKADFEEALRRMQLDPMPRVEVSKEHDFVTFDCAKGRVADGPSNAEYKECGGKPVISAGTALADMAMPCPRLEVREAKLVRQAWAYHEGAHARKKHIECRGREIQRTCIEWASGKKGRDAVARLLADLRASSLEELSQAQRVVFRDQYLALCIKAKEVEEPLLAKWRQLEREADEVAIELAGPDAFVCAMHGADLYMKARDLEESADHDSVGTRLLDGELERMSLQSPGF